METVKLYYENAFLQDFTAVVESCGAVKGGFAVVLDRTAFYPEGGGQPADGDDGVELLQKCVPVIQLLGVHGASSSDGFLLSCHIPPGFARFPLPVGGKCGIIPPVMRPWRNWYTRWISVMSPQ